MEVNGLAILAATVAMFAVGAFWYMVPFAKAWGDIHDFDKLSKAQQKEMQSKMGPFYGAQLVMTILSAWILAVMIGFMPDQSPHFIALLAWLGFVLPAQVSAVIFGGTEPKNVAPKIAIMASEALLHLQVAAFVIDLLTN
jgi:1,4-dihydroxy-2-naphthoate octaprenyltransferase